MEINGATPSKALQAVLAAMAEIADAQADVPAGEGPADPVSGAGLRGLSGMRGLDDAHGGVAPGTGQGVEHGPKMATAQAHAMHPHARLDRGAESALVQGLARPDTALPGASRPHEGEAAVPALAGSEFSLPADQLLNSAVIGLQVEPAFPWQLQRHGFDAQPQQVPLPFPRNDSPAAAPAAREDSRKVSEHDPGHACEHAGHEAGDGEAQDEHEEVEVDAAATQCSGRVPCDAADDWPESVSRALREALRAKPASQALLAAAEQWRLGRCVVLACPQGRDAAGPAWAFVLWPRHGSLTASPLDLFGLRVDARLHWSRLPPTLDWCHARVVKQQHPRQGRQLVALDARDMSTVSCVPCEVQLGPVPLRTPRWRDACVRIDAVRHFWNALGQQWSVTVVVGSRPLAGLHVPNPKEAPWEA